MARTQKITRSDKHQQYDHMNMAFSDAGGMSLRDYYAGQVFAGALTEEDDMGDVAHFAWDAAEVMMKVKEERGL